jgi:hypothetical protein
MLLCALFTAHSVSLSLRSVPECCRVVLTAGGAFCRGLGPNTGRAPIGRSPLRLAGNHPLRYLLILIASAHARPD